MADFIAVIRRAVDGLSDNTPQMRIKVYDRARSAVQRQLDNMKPRPADEVIARQMDKLDEAIATIEREFSGAADEPDADPVPVVEPTPPPAPEPEPEPEPVREPEPEPAPPVPSRAAYVEPEPEPEAVHHEPEIEPEPVHEAEPEPEADETFARRDDDAADDDTMPPASDDGVPDWYREPLEKHSEPAPTASEPAAVARSWEPWEREEPARPDKVDPVHPETPAKAWEPAVSDNPFHEPAEIFSPLPGTTPKQADASGLVAGQTRPGQSDPNTWWDDINAPAAKPGAPSSPGTSWDSFETFVGDRAEPQVEPDATQPKPAQGRDGMSISRPEKIENPTRPRPDRQRPPREEREGRGRLIAAVVVALIVLVGAGYAGWRFSDNILAFVNGGSSSTQTASKSTTSGDKQTQQTAPAGTKPADQQAATTPTQQSATGPQKFTQRLMPDGSEVDSGTQGEAVASATQGEGKSIANQNEKPAANAGTPAAATPAAQGEPAAQQTTQSAPVKMFLYEERLGQAQPTALEGTVTWSVKTDDQGGHNEKLIQGDISVPGRKMSAIFALRRNNDPTLPASHIIELTFSLPKDFEGRGIESVLRISMKNKEQEQGDPLIAVPAKITDYFHMIALNSFADAVKTNLDLLKTRDWIDIPLVYSNGRRALLTLQKGPEGEKVFDEVISSWQTTPSDIPVPSPAPPEPAATPAPAQ